MNKNYKFGYEILGPIFAEYSRECFMLLKLFDNKDAIALFATRGGARLQYLYEIFCEKMCKASPLETKLFYISRIAALKACGGVSLEEVEKFKNSEFHYLSSENFNNLIIKSNGDYPSECLSLDEQVQKIYSEQNNLYHHYLKSLVGNKKRIIFCDTGLYGNTQVLLSNAFPEWIWFGAYLMRANHRGLRADHFKFAFGLLSESDKYNPFNKSSIFLKYWHLIEDVLEPNVKSVQYLSLKDGLVSEKPPFLINKIHPESEEYFFRGIVDYMQSLTPLDWPLINKKYNESIRLISKKITFPRMKEIEEMTVGDRSKDVGFQDMSSILLPKNKKIKNKLENIKQSLWREAQIRIEFGLFWGHLFQILLEVRYYCRYFRDIFIKTRIKLRSYLR